MSSAKKNLNHLLLSQFSGQQAVITVPKIYYRLTQNLNKALILNQIIFYSDKSTYCQDGWFYKSYAEWMNEVYLTERSLRYHFKDLVKDNLIEMRIAKVKGVRTPFFRPLMDNIMEAIKKLLEADTPPPTEPTPESNTTPKKEAKTPLRKSCPKRKKFPDSQTAKISVSNTIYTDDSSDKKTTTVNPPPKDHENSGSEKNPSSSFFTPKQKNKLLALKLEIDDRSDDTFLEHCEDHIQKQKNDYGKFQRIAGLSKILTNLLETGEIFKSVGFKDPEEERKKKEAQAERERLQKEAQDRQHEEYLEKLRTPKEQPKPRSGTPRMLSDLLKGLINANAA